MSYNFAADSFHTTKLVADFFKRSAILDEKQGHLRWSYHHHHYPRISSQRKSWNKTLWPLCVTYYTTAV